MNINMVLHNVDLKDFTEILDSCEGDVFMVTPEGDRLNLRSKLCQLIGFTRLIEGGCITNAQIVCTNKKDESKLFRFNLYGKAGA